ncbi:uncharacterized protein N7515_007926 [Penicillium bovifimosum]|uniref:F-box domain-containing protein n=1 Tax=Penicillium bovifimosum TaxID=126998 RepID=A0A9W9GM18_9EURO|nr:uncharacterized protein N7515_007926 [Penicillium bovifimosum]KAJ5124101.1 hypothetical protein N7515_007926 [Penicillium bovifimosum]
MVNVQDLPLELLQDILSFIRNTYDLHEMDDGDGTDDLYNICLVSQKFRELAQPLLFRKFPDEEMDGDRCDRDKTICFTKAIYERPELGEHVRHIRIAPLPVKLKLLYPNMCIEQRHIKFYEGVIKDLQLGDMEKDWIRAMNSNHLCLFIALLVNKTPNFRSLYMPVGESTFEPFPYFFRRDPSFLSNLTTVSIEPVDAEIGYDIKHHRELLSLPKLREVFICHDVLLDMSFPSIWTPGTLLADTVVFIACHLEAGALGKFMRACKSLKTFAYSRSAGVPFRCRDICAPEFNAAQATEEALRHKDTLETFNVEFATYRYAHEIENIEEYNSTLVKYGSFADFSVLKVLDVSHAYLPAHPQLPASLIKLYISHCYSPVREMAQNIATDCKKGLYPHLTYMAVSELQLAAPIKIRGQRDLEYDTPEKCVLSHQDIFEGTNVKFAILSCRLPPPGYEDEEEDEESNNHNYNYDLVDYL